jgi:hypothetical protein
MSEPRDFYDRPIVYSRADPDDEYDNPKPGPLDPNLIDSDENDITEEEDELDEDEI